MNKNGVPGVPNARSLALPGYRAASLSWACWSR